MKKLCSLLLVGAIFLGLAGCVSTKPRQPLPNTTATTEPTHTQQVSVPVSHQAQYIRTNGGPDGARFPRVQIISDLPGLQDYYTKNREIYDLERKEQVYADTTVGFLDACDAYDDAFFKEHFLVVVILEEGSGSVRHQLRSVEQTPDRRLRVCIDSVLPGGIGTADMAQWHVILELDRSALVQSADQVLVYWNDLLVFDVHALPYQAQLPLKQPPDGILHTPEGDFNLTAGGYNWFYDTDEGLSQSVIADQSARPVPSVKHHPISISDEYAEIVYLPDSESNTCSPMNFKGFPMELSWAVAPDKVTYTCWPDVVLQDISAPELAVDSRQDQCFYAKPGGYVYEIVATWEGNGYHGTANYYVYIIGGV